MTTVKTTTSVRVSTSEAHAHIGQRTQFHTSGSLQGTYFRTECGMLPQHRMASYLRAQDADDFYAVYSYFTPIAWYAHGTWTVPDVRYSVTTSKHQNIVRKAVGL